MIILHGGIQDGTLLIWGEMAATNQKRWSRAHKSVTPPRSPLSVSNEELRQSLVALGCADSTSHVQDSIIWLPSQNGMPLPSQPLIGALPLSDGPITVQPWLVAALPYTDPAAIDLLFKISNDEVLAPGIIAGYDLCFLIRVARFVAQLVTRQRFLPGIIASSAGFVARWQLVLIGNDATVAEALARSLPAACRALNQDALVPPTLPAHVVLERWMEALLDHLVRHAFSTSTRDGHRIGTTAAVSVHDQWLHALRAPDGTMHGSQHALVAFADQVREWSQRLAMHHAAHFRLCFRLEEPEVTNEASGNSESLWQVRYLAQARTDPSLLIPLTDLWKSGKRSATDAATLLPVSRAALLAALGEAALLAPTIEASLKQRTPGSFTCDTQGAFTFLTETAWLLEDAGFGVLLPAWWTRRGTKTRLTAKAKVKSPQLSGNRIGLDALVSVDWEVALGDDLISLEELMALAHLKAPLIKVRGQWIQVTADDLRAALAFLRQGPRATKLRDVIRLALSPQHDQALSLNGIVADGWVADLLTRLQGGEMLADEPVPHALHATLRPYQQRGYAWLAFLSRWGLGACLADDMGLGKTIQTLTLIQRHWEEQGPQPVLLICPTSVLENWRREAQRFTPDLSVMIHHGATRQREEVFLEAAARHAIVLSSYALLYRDRDLFQRIHWRGIVLDEAQNIKNADTKQARAARAIPSDYRVALTGTPVENHVGDLWSLMTFLNPGFLGTESAFRRDFFLPIQGAHDVAAAAKLKQLTGPFLLRRLKTDPTIITDLPEKLEMPTYCSLTKEQASLYAATLHEMEETVDAAEGLQRKGIILATLTKLKQICNHPAHFLGDGSPLPGRSGKLARLEEMVMALVTQGDRALIFTQFTVMGEMLRQRLQAITGREVLFLSGKTPRVQRDQLVERFQHEVHGPPLFILSLKAGGVGLNLTRANHVCHFDRWWNPAVEQQATDRAFRIGQTQHVQVHTFICAGTVEERISDLIASKREMATSIVGSGEGWLTELSTTHIKDLFALQAEAIEVDYATTE